jgi:benzoylformate decarboxylase
VTLTDVQTGSRTATRGADVLLDVLSDWGVDRIFICPGSTEAAFLDATLDRPDIELVLTTHEAVSVAAADGYARARGRPAVVYLHTHLGLANGVPHLSCAHRDASPVVILCGLKSTRLQGESGFTTTADIRGLARQHVKSDWQALRGDAIATDVTQALRTAAIAPAGPTFLALAQDLLEAEVDGARPDAAGFRVPARTRVDPEAIATAAARLASAQRPLIVAGAEIARSGAVAELALVAERLNAPVVTEDGLSITTTAFGADHPNFAGRLGPALEAAGEADLIFLAGARTPVVFEAKLPRSLPAATPLVHLSADASDVARLNPTAVPLVGDARLGLTDLLAALEERPDAPGREFLERSVDAYRAELAGAQDRAERNADAVPIPVEALMHRLARTLEPGDALVDDSVSSRAALETHAVARPGISYFATSGGSLGWGMAAALGISLADPGRRVVAVTGDGSFQFGVPALWTAVRYGIPVTYVIVNNSSYAAVKAALHRFGGQAVERGVYPATGIEGPRIDSIASGFGALGRRVERMDELDPALAEAAANDGPAVVEVMTNPEDIGN